MLSVACSRCRHLIRLGDHAPGQSVCCPACHARFTVPSAAPAKPPAAWAVRAPSWPLLAAALLPLGIPLVNRGAAWVALGGGLAAACLVLSVCPRPALVLRLGLALALGVLGYAPALAARLAGAGESPAPALRPAGGPVAVETGTVGQRFRGRPAMPLPDSTAGPRSMLPALTLPPPVEPLPPSGPRGADAEPRLAARVAEALAAATDPEAGAALLLTRRGGLRHYSYPDFRLRGSYRLDRPAYRAALDGRRGLLFVASCPARALTVGTTGDREVAPGDVRVYDVAALLRGAERPGVELRPAVTFPDQVYVPGLALSPDRRWLYYLGVAPQLVTAYRRSTDRRSPDGQHPVPGGAVTLTLSPDGQALYALTSSSVVGIEPRSLQVTRRAPLPFVPNDLAADNGGRVFVGSRGERPVVLALDLRRGGAVLGHYKAPFPGRLYLGLTPDGRRLYLGTSSLTADRILGLRVDGERASQPQVEGAVSTDDDGLVRGEFRVTPDGQFLLNRWGKVYRLPAGG
jgi:hypothetical protein